MDDFRKEVLKVNESRVHKVNKSLGVYDSYKWIRKNKWLDIGRPLTEHEFYTIIRQINNLFADNIIDGNDIHLPHRMGDIELRKYENIIEFRNGVLVDSLPIDWDRTLKLWYEDEEAYKNKTLIKMEEKETFRVFYNKRTANYENKSFMQLEANRNLKLRLKQKIKNKTIDAFKI